MFSSCFMNDICRMAAFCCLNFVISGESVNSSSVMDSREHVSINVFSYSTFIIDDVSYNSLVSYLQCIY